jgi:hypothetical protein
MYMILGDFGWIESHDNLSDRQDENASETSL